ncbi:hypothetical protein SAMN05216388_1017134 [Halorientalis persicus]|uniref:Uncharacterized protein n=1 Tax=Halorientalis persicus TaxID=1367881 RepID=A0A1H8S3L2_9EURY|nr:hypothetical protein SAMN05216388_1017134 [Halorientalis persicus]
MTRHHRVWLATLVFVAAALLAGWLLGEVLVA